MKHLGVCVFVLLLAACTARAAPRVFVFTELQLRDPHTWAVLPFLGCNDITDQVPLGLGPSFNQYVNDALSTDGDGDGLLDLSPIVAFLDEDVATGWGTPAGGAQWNPQDPGGELAFHLAACTAPQATTVCEQDVANPVQYALYANAVGGTCLSPIAGTTSAYSPPITLPAAPCFTSDPFGMFLEVAGLRMDLRDARIAATYVGSPPSSLVDGLIGGFLAEADADTLLISPNVPLVGGQPLSSILPGGTGCCAPQDDRDLGPDGQTLGWWIYFNFRATLVELTPTDATVRATAEPGLRLDGAVPNPFTSSTVVSFALPRSGPVRLRVLDVAGRLVTTLVEGQRPAGAHAATWSGADAAGSPAAPGIYFIRLEWGDEALTRRVVRLR